MSSDTKGHVNELPMPTRLKDYLESKTMYSDRVRLLNSEDHLFVVVIESLPGYLKYSYYFCSSSLIWNRFTSCMADKVSVAVIDPLTFRVLTESRFEFNDTTVDVALERSSDGKVLLAIGQMLSGVWVYSLEDESFNFFQVNWTMFKQLMQYLHSFLSCWRRKEWLRSAWLVIKVRSFWLQPLTVLKLSHPSGCSMLSEARNLN